MREGFRQTIRHGWGGVGGQRDRTSRIVRRRGGWFCLQRCLRRTHPAHGGGVALGCDHRLRFVIAGRVLGPLRLV